MDKTLLKYPAFVHQVEKSYDVSFPDFPNCQAQGVTPTDTYMRAKAMLQTHVEDLMESGGTLPRPSRLKEADQKARINRALLVTLIPVEFCEDPTFWEKEPTI